MVETSRTAHQDGDDAPIMAELAEQFSVPVQNVRAIYGKERRRLEAGARIHNFLTVLAIGNTRSILRSLSLEHARGNLH